MSHFNLKIDDLSFKSACKKKTSGQRQVYELFIQPVYNLILRMTQNQADALDISQDTFIKVFAKINQIKSQEMLGFWIRKIAINTTFSYMKKNKDIITNVDFKEKSYTSNSYENITSIEFALSKLTSDSRTVLWLYEVEGMTHEEISKQFGKSVSFSKSQLSRAKKTAQKYLTQKGAGYELRK